MMQKYKIYTLGCKVNQYESALLVNALSKLGFKQVENGADFVIINTCAVTKSAITKDGRMVNKARKENPGAKIYTMGCLLRIENDFVKNYKIDKFSQSRKPENILKDFGFENIENISDFAEIERSRYFVKIQDGCEQFCSYCIIPYTRGKMKSRNESDILFEIERAIQRGYKEIVLSGIHIGLFGKERGNKEKTDLTKLLSKIVKIKGEFKVRISSIEITEVNDELIDLIKSSNKVCKHLHISLQSGSDKILKAMNRPYDREYFKKRVKKIRENIPGIAISTDIIVGFPGETGELFLETYNFVKEILFSKIHVFSFSAHEQTPAYSLPEKISSETIKERSKKLRALSFDLENKFKESKKGEMVEGIIESIDGDRVKIRSEYHFDVVKNKNDIEREILIGELIKMRFI